MWCSNLPLNNRPRRGDVRQTVDADSVNKHRFSEPMESQRNHFNIELDWIKVSLVHIHQLPDCISQQIQLAP